MRAAQPGSPRGSSPARPCTLRGTAARGFAVPVCPPGATGGAQPPRPEADPVLLTGDWRSRCPASRSSALGSCAAGLMLGIDRGSRCPARIHAGSSTRTRKERAAFLQERGFPTASPFPSHTARQARGHTVLPRPGSRRDPTARRCPRERGARGRGAGDTGMAAPAPKGKPRPSASRAPAAAAAARAGGPGPARLDAPRAHTQPRMPFQIWRGWPDSVKGGVGLRR